MPRSCPMKVAATASTTPLRPRTSAASLGCMANFGGTSTPAFVTWRSLCGSKAAPTTVWGIVRRAAGCHQMAALCRGLNRRRWLATDPGALDPPLQPRDHRRLLCSLLCRRIDYGLCSSHVHACHLCHFPGVGDHLSVLYELDGLCCICIDGLQRPLRRRVLPLTPAQVYFIFDHDGFQAAFNVAFKAANVDDMWVLCRSSLRTLSATMAQTLRATFPGQLMLRCIKGWRRLRL